MEVLGNLFLLFCIGLAAYEFILKPLNISIRIGPIVDTLADTIRAALPPIGRFVHWLIVGKPRAGYVALSELSRHPSREAGNVHSDALEWPTERTEESTLERPEYTKEELTHFLARVQLVGTDGVAAPLAKAKISQAVGIRAEDASTLIDAARGMEPRTKPEPYQFEKAGGRDSHIRTGVKRLR